MCPVIHFFHSWNRRYKGITTCTKQQVIAFISFFTTFHGILIDNASFSSYDVHAMRCQLCLDTQNQFTNHLLLTSHNLTQIKRCFRNCNRILTSMFGIIINLSRVKQCLGWNTTFIQTYTAQVFLLEQNHT